MQTNQANRVARDRVVEELTAEIQQDFAMSDDQATRVASDWLDVQVKLNGLWKLSDDERVQLRNLFVNGWIKGHERGVIGIFSRN